MSFTASSEDIRVDGGSTLRGRLRTESGNWVDAHINLNEFIGNKDGRFEWGGKNFTDTAEDIRYAIEGGASVPVLRARLKKLDGEWVEADINLAERVQNDNGRFEFH